VDPDNLLSKEQLGVFCNGSEERLAAAVRDLITQPASRLQLAARGREHARSRHSLANAHQLANLLDHKVAA
jgi:hypothetical protein